MKVLFFSSPGFADCDFPMVKALLEKGVDVTYVIELTAACQNSTLFNIARLIPQNEILPASAYAELKVYEKYIDLTRVFILNRPTKSAYGLSGIKSALKLFNFARKNKFDVIHTDHQPYMWNILLYFFRRKLLLTVHDPFPHSGEHTLKKVIFRGFAFRLCRAFVLLNRSQRDCFCATYRISPERVFQNSLGIYECMNETDYEKNSPYPFKYVLFFGRISPYKGVRYLCEAAVDFHKTNPDVHIVIAGNGKFDFDISKYEKLPYFHIENRFITTAELSRMLNFCEFTVCPYTDATQSGVVMSSFAFKKVVIASNVGGLKEMIDDRQNGVLVPPKDVSALVEAMSLLAQDKRKRAEMERCIESRYCYGDGRWEKIAENYIDVYKKVVCDEF